MPGGPTCPPRLPHGDLRGLDDGYIRRPVQRPVSLPHGAGLLQQQGDVSDGHNDDDYNDDYKVACYNTLTSTWATPDIRAPVPSGRRSHSALALENGKILMFGGG